MTIGVKKEGVGYIIPPRKTRVDIGDIFPTPSGKDVELIYLCPHAAMFIDQLVCPYYSKNGYGIPQCPKYLADHTCWKMREVKYVETVKHARLIGKDFVAMDDIVDVKVGFIGGNGLWDQLGKRNQFAARVVEFGGTDITLDISSEFWSRQVEVPYGKIESIKRREEKC